MDVFAVVRSLLAAVRDRVALGPALAAHLFEAGQAGGIAPGVERLRAQLAGVGIAA